MPELTQDANTATPATEKRQRKSAREQLAALEQRRKQLEARIQKEEARDAKRERKQRTQRMLLIGSAIMAYLHDKNADDEERAKRQKEIDGWCRNYLTPRDYQRL